MYLKRLSVSSLLFTIAALILCGSVNATSLFDPSVTPTNSINGSTVRLDGTVFSSCCGAEPWTVDAFGSVGECLRFDLAVVPQGLDLELVVVGPDGTAFRSDSGHPVVKIGSVSDSGWFTVHVANRNGLQVEGTFTILYGRYPLGNVNCTEGAGPTPPL